MLYKFTELIPFFYFPAVCSGPFPYLHFGIDAVRDLVPELAGAGVRLGQQEWVGQGAVLWLHDLRRHILARGCV